MIDPAQVLVCTVATQRTAGLWVLEASCRKFGIDLQIFGMGQIWRGFGWRQRVLFRNLLRRYFKYQYVLFVDGYDSVFGRPLDDILRRFLDKKTRLLFGAEVVSHPLPAECYPPSVDAYRYRYLNAGGFIGELRYTVKLMARLGVFCLYDWYYDQRRYAEAFISGRTEITLDHQADIFQCLFFASGDVGIEGGQIVNYVTGTSPCIIHGNGGEDLSWVRDFVLKRVA